MITASSLTLAFIPFVGNIGSGEMIVIGVVAVLLFGKRLPEVGRSLGKSLVEFKKGMQGIENEIRSATAFDVNAPAPRRSVSSYREEDDRTESAVPHFEPPPAADNLANVPRFEPPRSESSSSESATSESQLS